MQHSTKTPPTRSKVAIFTNTAEPIPYALQPQPATPVHNSETSNLDQIPQTQGHNRHSTRGPLKTTERGNRNGAGKNNAATPDQLVHANRPPPHNAKYLHQKPAKRDKHDPKTTYKSLHHGNAPSSITLLANSPKPDADSPRKRQETQNHVLGMQRSYKRNLLLLHAE